MTTLPIPSSSSPHNKEWLPLPSILVTDDSFADDLIRQFDKKRSSLHKDLGQEQTQQPQSRKSSPATSDQSISIIPAPTTTTPERAKSPSPPRSTRKPRRSSAGELLRQSSAFFKTTLDTTWKNISRSHENLYSSSNDSNNPQQGPPIEAPLLPETIAIHTTITFPPIAKKSSSSAPFPPLLLSPPVISQYPPKPLQYSPITIPAESFPSSSPHKTLMHRLSMPALRRQNSTVNNQHRNPSNNTNIPFFIKRKKSSQL